MTKEIFFDLAFTNIGILALSTPGADFLRLSVLLCENNQQIYRSAINCGLHVRFENTTVRDRVTGTI